MQKWINKNKLIETLRVYDYDNNAHRAHHKLAKVNKLIKGFKKPFTHKRLIKSNVLCAHLSDYIVHWCFATEAHSKLIAMDQQESDDAARQHEGMLDLRAPRFEQESDEINHAVAQPLDYNRTNTNYQYPDRPTGNHMDGDAAFGEEPVTFNPNTPAAHLQEDIPQDLQDKIHRIIERKVKERINQEVYEFKLQIRDQLEEEKRVDYK